MCKNFDINLFMQRVHHVTTLVKHACTYDKTAKQLWKLILNDSIDLLKFTTLPLISGDEHPKIAEMVFSTQKSLVDKLEINKASNLEYYKCGRLLVCFVTISTYMGTAETVSRGLFDDVDFPPYCTWLCWIPETKQSIEHLLVWIPPEFIKDATDAVEMVAEGHLVFATDEEFKADYKPILMKLGLLV